MRLIPRLPSAIATRRPCQSSPAIRANSPVKAAAGSPSAWLVMCWRRGTVLRPASQLSLHGQESPASHGGERTALQHGRWAVPPRCAAAISSARAGRREPGQLRRRLGSGAAATCRHIDTTTGPEQPGRSWGTGTIAPVRPEPTWPTTHRRRWRSQGAHAHRDQEPSIWKVVLLNDDYTPMEFGRDPPSWCSRSGRAYRIMMQVHMQGRGV